MKLSEFVCTEFGNLICFAYGLFIENEPESEKDDKSIEELYGLIYEIKTGETYVDDYFSQKMLELYFKGFMVGAFSLINSGKSIQSIVEHTFIEIKRKATNDEWMYCKNVYDKYIIKFHSYYGKEELKLLIARRID